MACGIISRKVDNQADGGDRLESDPPDPKAVDLDYPGQRLRRADQETACTVFYVSAIVRNESCEGKGSLRGCGDKIPDEPRLAGASRAADQCCFRTNENR